MRQMHYFSMSERKRYMKNKVWLLFLLSFLVSCRGSAPSSDTELEGRMSGVSHDTLWLFGADNLYPFIYTIPVHEGKFAKVLERVDTLSEAWLLFTDGTQYPIYLDKGAKLKIRGTKSSIEITGSPENDLLTSFMKSVRARQNADEKSLKQMADTFVAHHLASLPSIYVLNKFLIQTDKPDYATARARLNSMPGEMRDRVSAAQLLSMAETKVNASVGTVLPYFYMTNPNNVYIYKRNYANKVLLLHFWASWDEDSRLLNRKYRQLYNRLRNQSDVALVGISIDMNKKDWLQAIQADSLRWEQLCDLNGLSGDLVNRLAIDRIPTSYLIDKEGIIRGIDVAADSLLTAIEQLRSAKNKENSRPALSEREVQIKEEALPARVRN